MSSYLSNIHQYPSNSIKFHEIPSTSIKFHQSPWNSINSQLQGTPRLWCDMSWDVASDWNGCWSLKCCPPGPALLHWSVFSSGSWKAKPSSRVPNISFWHKKPGAVFWVDWCTNLGAMGDICIYWIHLREKRLDDGKLKGSKTLRCSDVFSVHVRISSVPWFPRQHIFFFYQRPDILNEHNEPVDAHKARLHITCFQHIKGISSYQGLMHQPFITIP